MEKLTVNLGFRNIFRGEVLSRGGRLEAFDEVRQIRLPLGAPIGSLLTGGDLASIRKDGKGLIRIGYGELRDFGIAFRIEDGEERLVLSADGEVFDPQTVAIAALLPGMA